MRYQRTVVATIADPHSGSTAGLIPDRPWQLDSSGTYRPTKEQREVYRFWRSCWKQVGPMRADARLVVLVAGDSIDGVHHDTVQLVTARIDEQERIHAACMDEALSLAGWNKAKGDALYYIRGTRCHVGQGGRAEEVLARDLGAAPVKAGTAEHKYRDGQYSWERLRSRVNGQLIDIAHQGPGPGGKWWTKGNSVRSELKNLYLGSLRQKCTMPRLWMRAHRHRRVWETLHEDGTTIDGFLLPAWQLWTEHVGQVASSELISDIGMHVTSVEVDGSMEFKELILQMEGAPVNEL